MSPQDSIKFGITICVSLLQLKFQTNPSSPLDTHLLMMYLFGVVFLIYLVLDHLQQLRATNNQNGENAVLVLRKASLLMGALSLILLLLILLPLLVSQVYINLKDTISQRFEEFWGQKPKLLDPVLVHMGSMYSTLRKFEKSVSIYQRAIDIMEKKYGPNSVFLATPFLGMAKALASIGKATKAIEFYHRSITVLESNRGPQSEDLLIPLFGLGNLLLQEGKAKDAETPFLRILDIYTKLHGEYDGRVGMAMCSLAHAKCAMGKADEAIHLYRNALQLVKDSNYLAMDDSTVEKIRIDLAELLHVVGRGKEGRELLEE